MSNLKQLPRFVNVDAAESEIFSANGTYPEAQFLKDLADNIAAIEKSLNNRGEFYGPLAIGFFRLRALIHLYRSRQ